MPYRVMEYDHRCCEVVKAIEETVLPSSVRNGAVCPSRARARTDDIWSSRPVFPQLARQVGTKGQDGRHCVVLHRPPPSSIVLYSRLSSPAVFRCFPMFSAVARRPPPSPAVLCSYLLSPGRSCLRSWGSSSLLMTAVLGIQERARTAFYSPVSSGGLGSPPPTGSYGGPGRLRTLLPSHRPPWTVLRIDNLPTDYPGTNPPLSQAGTANAHGLTNRLRENYWSTSSILGHGRTIPDTIRSARTGTVGRIPGFSYSKLFLFRSMYFDSFIAQVVAEGMAGSVVTNLEIRGRVHRACSYHGD